MLQRYMLFSIILALLLLTGCDDERYLPAKRQTTSATLTIQWPARERLIPLAAQSIRIHLSGPYNFTTEQLIPRPTVGLSSRIIFPKLPIGELTVTATAYPEGDGSGVAQAAATVMQTTQAGTPLALTITMASTITQLAISPAVPSIAVAETCTLQATAKNTEGAVVLVPTQNAYTWISSNPSIAEVDQQGVVTGKHAGTVMITATENESGVSSVLEYEITPDVFTSALVLYDTSGEYWWAGNLYATQLSNLLAHFNITTEIKPVEDYQSSDMKYHGWLFYIGVNYDNPLPDAFFQDILTTKKPVCWLGSNIWQLAFNYPNEFSDKFGVDYDEYDFSEANSGVTVQYKGQTLYQDPWESSLILLKVTDPERAAVVATCTKNGTTRPYITHSGNFWYFASNPFLMVGFEDKYLAFADCLHDILGAKLPAEHSAFIRVEDITPIADPEKLREIADVMARHNVPFGVCVIPVFRDPLGWYGEGNLTVTLNDRPEVVAALKYMVEKGGQIVLHGYTHQYGDIANPYDGTSAVDFEFFRLTLDGSGNQVMVGPVAEDSFAWALNRVQLGKAMLTELGLPPVAWNTPHYLASDTDYSAFKQEFDYSLDRGLYFTNTTGRVSRGAIIKSRPEMRAGRSANQYYLQQMAPYPLRDCYGIQRIPETLGYLDPMGESSPVPTLPADLIRRAQAQLVVRDGWAGSYYHWHLDTSYLDQLLDGIQGLGYTYQRIPGG